MKRILLTSVLLTIGMLVMAAMVTAGVPSLINYQGRLTNSSGNPLDTTVSITFSIYTDSVGGVAIWSETYPAVNVANGLFTVKLGSMSPGNWDENLFLHSYPPGRWLGIKVGGNAEMAARSMFTTTPFAVQASCVDGFNPGSQNVDSGEFTFVAGDSNTVLGDYGSIAGGYGNLVSAAISPDTTVDTTIPPPSPSFEQAIEFPITDLFHPPANCDSPTGIVVGGKNNSATFVGSGVGWGACNKALSNFAAIVGGCNNVVAAQYSFIGGGYHNHIAANPNNSGFQTIAGGLENTSNGAWSTIGGGVRNIAGSPGGTPSYSTISGGRENQALGLFSAIGGGYNNRATAYASTIPGGSNNEAAAWFSIALGGAFNKAAGNYSYAAGFRAKVLTNHHGTFVWADHTNADFSSTGPDQFLIRATGGVGIGVNNPSVSLDIVDKIRIRGGSAAANRVLTSIDATGTAEWKDIGAVASDDDWDKEPSAGPTEVLETHGAWGIARHDNFTAGRMYGTARNTHVNLGLNSTTGRSGQNYQSAVVGGGVSNQAIGHFTTIGGGHSNVIGNGNVPAGDEARLATIAGGYMNEVHGVIGFVGGGEKNKAYDMGNAIGGGSSNEAGVSGGTLSEGAYASISGGLRNYAQGYMSTIGGGYENQAAGIKSTIGGGDSNYVAAGALSGTISGGHFNAANDIGATISGGYYNITETSAPYATIGGGNYNRVTDYAGTIAGGELDTVLAEYGTVGGGNEHYINTNAIWGTVAGGNDNRITDSGGAILGGQNNTAAGSFAGIGGGKNNMTLGHCSVIPGGNDNRANGRFSLAAGQQAQSLHDGSFVWNDNAAGIFASTAQNQFLIHAAGNTGIMTNAPHSTLHDNGSIAVGFRSTAVNITATSSDCIIAGTANLTITLPPAAGITGRIYTIKNTGGAGTIVIVDANGGEFIDLALTYPVASMMWVTIVSNGIKWLIIGN